MFTDYKNMCDYDMNVLFPVAGAECDAEPPHLTARSPGGYSVCIQSDHSGPGRGHACQLAQLHCHPAAARHEVLPQPPTGQVTDYRSILISWQNVTNGGTDWFLSYQPVCC